MNLHFDFLKFCLLSPIFFPLFSLFSVSEKILNFACDPDLDSSPTLTDLYENPSWSVLLVMVMAAGYREG